MLDQVDLEIIEIYKIYKHSCLIQINLFILNNYMHVIFLKIAHQIIIKLF